MAYCFVTRQLPGTALERLAAVHEVDIWPERLPPDPATLRKLSVGAAGLLTMVSDPVDASLIAASSGLEAIANYGVGYDNVDVEAATERGIRVGNTPDVLTDATADLTFALLLAAARKLPQAIATVRAGDWITWEPMAHLGAEVQGATLGIVGLGRIGQAVARRAQGFDMNVLHTGSRSGSRISLESLLQRSDFVSLHCPLTPETFHLINERTLALMRPTAILINTARGPIVDQPALRTALENGTIAGAALDVTDPEPLPANDPLLSGPNLIVAPHIGSGTRAARERMADLAVENLLAALAGRRMPHQVNEV
ncbi:MAG: D-glycerate dehydrogenase [Solirubrobacterales bacterium]|nr:D-glycerate dehydrogenase [Solirubrobacterales bacterium]